MAVFGRTLSRRVYPETSRVGDCPGSLGPATHVVAMPGGAESVQVGVVLSSKTPAKATDRRGIRERNPMAKGSVRLRSLTLKHSLTSAGRRSGAKPG
jgi:hypothetical protein